MIESSVKRPPEQPTADLGELLEDALHQAKSLMQAELSLARRELVTELKSTASSLLLLVVGVTFIQAALATLGVLLVLVLGVGAASVGVVIALAAVGAGLVLVARRALARQKLPHTTARLTLDAKQVMETVK